MIKSNIICATKLTDGETTVDLTSLTKDYNKENMKKCNNIICCDKISNGQETFSLSELGKGEPIVRSNYIFIGEIYIFNDKSEEHSISPYADYLIKLGEPDLIYTSLQTGRRYSTTGIASNNRIRLMVVDCVDFIYVFITLGMYNLTELDNAFSGIIDVYQSPSFIGEETYVSVEAKRLDELRVGDFSLSCSLSMSYNSSTNNSTIIRYDKKNQTYETVDLQIRSISSGSILK